MTRPTAGTSASARVAILTPARSPVGTLAAARNASALVAILAAARNASALVAILAAARNASALVAILAAARNASALVAILALASLSACGPSAADREAAAADSAAAAAEVARRDSIALEAGLDACELVTTADLARISGLDLREGQLLGNFQGVSQCRWDQVGVEASNSGYSISLRQPGDMGIYSSVQGATPVAGLGDEAYWNPNTHQMALRVGTRVASLAVLIENAARDRWTREAADLVVAKLKATPETPAAGAAPAATPPAP
jgi:hypothetical protein